MKEYITEGKNTAKGKWSSKMVLYMKEILTIMIFMEEGYIPGQTEENMMGNESEIECME